jgi:hypothetical protein
LLAGEAAASGERRLKATGASYVAVIEYQRGWGMRVPNWANRAEALAAGERRRLAEGRG